MGYTTKPKMRSRWHCCYHPIDSGSSDVSGSLSSSGVKSEAQAIKEKGFLTVRNLVCIFIANYKCPAGEFCWLHL